MPATIDTRLTLNPNNQIAFLGAVEGLIVDTEYDVTGEFLRADTRFVFKGRSDVALTKRPQGVPARQTQVEARVTPTPPPDDKVVVTPLATKSYPWTQKDRLDANGLNISFLPAVGGTLRGALTITSTFTPSGQDGGQLRLSVYGAGSNAGYGSMLRNDSADTYLLVTNNNNALGPWNALRPWYVDNATGNMTIGHNLAIGGITNTGSSGYFGGELSAAGHLSLASPVQYADKSIAYIFRQDQPPGWRRLGIAARSGITNIYPLEELGITATVVNTSYDLNVGHGLGVAGDAYIAHSLTVIGSASVSGTLSLQQVTATTIYAVSDIVAGGNMGCQRIFMSNGAEVRGANLVIYDGWGLVVTSGGVSAGPITGTYIYATNTVSASDLVQGYRIYSTTTLSCAGLLTSNGGLGVYGGDVGIYGGYGLHIDGGGSLNVTGGFAASTVHSVNWIIAETYITSQGGSIISRGSIPMVACFDVPTATSLGMWSASRNLYLGSTYINGGPAVTMITLNPDLADITSHGDFFPDSDGYRYLGMGGPAWYAVYSYQYVTMSDPSVKRDIAPLPDRCLDLVEAIEPKTYKLVRTREGDEDRTHWGFLAPDVAAAMDHAGHEFGGVTTGSEVAGLAYNELIAVLWGAVRELAAELAELKEVRDVVT